MSLMYKIIQGTARDCQKILNQWKYEYDIEILQMGLASSTHNAFEEDWLSILLIRREKL